MKTTFKGYFLILEQVLIKDNTGHKNVRGENNIQWVNWRNYVVAK